MIVPASMGAGVFLRLQGVHHVHTGPLPRQIFPKAISREYERKLIALVPVMESAFVDLRRELPSLLASAAAEHPTRTDALRLDAGEGKRVRELVAAAKKRMQQSILTPELDRLAAEFAKRTTTAQRIQLGKQTKAALGVDVFGSDERIPALVDAFINSNVGYISNLTDEMAGRVEKQTLLAVQTATPWSEFAKTLDEQFDFGETRARIIARDQLGKLYGQTNAARQRDLGVSHFIWRTSEDERVRPEHEALDGRRFAYSDPPSEGLPGEPVLCRCSAEPDFSTILGG